MTTLLEARHVAKLFSSGLLDRHATMALEDFSLAIDSERPSITAVVGESGSGKTTLARLLLGLVAPTRGEVLYQGQDLQNMAHAAWRAFRRDVQVIFQDPYEVYNPFYRVDHVLTTPVTKFKLASSRAAARALIAEVLQAVGLRPEETLGRFPHQLSGGMKQRACIAIAINLRPQVIIADEPTSALDVVVQKQVMETLARIQKDLQAAVILVGHDMGLMAQFVDRLGVMYAGQLVEVSPVRDIFTQPLHPYTQMLIASLPSLEQKGTFRGIPGLPPPLRALPPGCVFHPRCPHAVERCQTEAPLFREVRPQAWAACHLL